MRRIDRFRCSMSWNIWIMNEQITISAFRCMSSNIWTLNIWIINERITISASQIESDFRIKKAFTLKLKNLPQKFHVTLHVVHPQVGFTLVARFNQLGGQLLHPVLERRGKPTNPFQKFPPSDATMPTVSGQRKRVSEGVGLARMFSQK